MTRFILEGEVRFKVEDGGWSRIAEISDDREFFVRLHSYSEGRVHAEADALEGKRVRVTVEALD